MSDPFEHDDPYTGDRGPSGLHDIAQHDIASLALGEQVDPSVDDHVRTCPLCRRDVDAYRQVANLARASKHATDVPSEPPPHVWAGIVAELGLSGAEAGRPIAPFTATAGTHVGTRSPSWRRALLAAAAVVALAGAGVAGWATGHRTSDPAADRSSQALLAAQPGTSTAASGKAVVHASADGYTLSVSAAGLPVPTGYYEVWLFDPASNEMVAIGTLGAGDRGSFTMPDGIDLTAYHVVDVSAQKYDGNNAHQRSVLRGPLAP